MRKTILLLFFCTVAFSLHAQEDKPRWFSVSTSLSTGAIFDFDQLFHRSIDYHARPGFSVGLEFSREVFVILAFKTGFLFSKNSFNYTYTDSNGQLVESATPDFIELFTIPLSMEVRINNTFVISPGIQFDKQINRQSEAIIDKQSGLGFHLKMGRRINFDEHTYLLIMPETTLHTAIPFRIEPLQQRFIEFGLRVVYGFR